MACRFQCTQMCLHPKAKFFTRLTLRNLRRKECGSLLHMLQRLFVRRLELVFRPARALHKGSVKRAREELVFHFPHYQSDDGPHSSIRLGNLKLIHFDEDDRVSLFDLSKDIGERNDLAKQMPNETKMLQERLTKYLTEVNAQRPTKNTDFDPSQPVAPIKGGKGGKKGTNKK